MADPIVNEFDGLAASDDDDSTPLARFARVEEDADAPVAPTGELVTVGVIEASRRARQEQREATRSASAAADEASSVSDDSTEDQTRPPRGRGSRGGKGRGSRGGGKAKAKAKGKGKTATGGSTTAVQLAAEVAPEPEEANPGDDSTEETKAEVERVLNVPCPKKTNRHQQ